MREKRGKEVKVLKARREKRMDSGQGYERNHSSLNFNGHLSTVTKSE
jgi:hypothetical protein